MLADFTCHKPTLETERLLLRPLRPADAADLAEWTMNESLYRYWGKRPGKSDKDPREMFRAPEKPGKSFHWGVEYRPDGKVVGEVWVYLIENDRMAKLAIRLSPAYQGRGLGTEAVQRAVRFCFTETELLRLWTDVDARNAASARMLEKCGFTREGTIRQGKMVSTWCDYHLYGILKSDPGWKNA